ncbi:hypothetical protein Tco_1465715 [Tanacetum coccineum]
MYEFAICLNSPNSQFNVETEFAVSLLGIEFAGLLKLSTTFKPKEPTFQVALDVLSLTPFYQAFLISASVPAIYMHEFWATVTFQKHHIRFKMNKKSYSFDLEMFRNMLQICPKVPGQKFEDPPFEEEILAFISDIGYPGHIKSLSEEDLVYQIENKVSKRNKDMYYPRFTKTIINHFMSQDQSIPRRNKVDWHMANDDPILTTMRFIPQHEVVQKYGAILPDNLTNQAMKESEAYKTYYAFATGKAIPKPKYVRRSAKEKTEQAPKASSSKRIKATAKVTRSGKKKQLAKGLETVSYANGSGAHKVTSVTPGVLDVPTYRSDDEHISWKSSEEDDDNEASISKDDDDNTDDDNDDQDDDDERTESDNNGDDFVHPKFTTHEEEERLDEEDKDEESFDPRVHTPSHVESTNDEEYDEVTLCGNDEEEKLEEEKTNKEEEVNELYEDLNINLGRSDAEMIDAQNIQDTEDAHVTLTDEPPVVQQQSSSVSSSFVSNMLNPNPDTGIDSILNPNIWSTPLVDVPISTSAEIPPSFATTLPTPPIPLIQHQQQTPFPTPTTVLSSSLQNLPNFGSLFGFDNRLKTLEQDFLEFKQTNQFAEAVSSIPDIKIIKEQVKAQVKKQVSKILPRIEKLVNDQLEAEVLIRSSNKAKTSHVVAANLSELELKKILIDKMENNKSINRSDQQKNLYKSLVDAYEADKSILDTYGDIVTFKRRREDKDDDEEPSAGSDRGSKRRRARKEPESTSAPKEKTSMSTGKSKEGSKSRHKSTGKSAHAEEPIHTVEDLEEPAHQEFVTGVTEDQPVDETAQLPDWFQKPAKLPSPDRDWNKTLPAIYGSTQPWLSTLARKEDPPITGPTFELMKGTCKSIVELEYFFEEVYKTTTEQLDWNNPKGQQYPHDLRKPLPLIPNSRGRQVIPFDHFINNDLVYLSGGVSSRTYATSVTKTKAADHGHIKWIEELVPNTLESARDVYSKRRIIAVTKLRIVEWHGYKHLDWITVRRDDDKLYKFKEGDFKRLRLQDIEDMLILLVQGKLTNLTVEERIESPDTYRSNLKRREAYTAYSNPRGFIYQNKDKKNKLMHIDELHKFSDGTLIDVRTALDDLLKGIRMEYLP